RAAHLIFYNLENNTSVSTTRSDADLEAAKRRVVDVAEAIAGGQFPAKPGYQCTLCPYRNLCPETEKIVAVPEKKTSHRVN
ncbi:MAG TPA: PD-(D/E)XK nuclease family protein, partial [Terriglobales bacterium]